MGPRVNYSGLVVAGIGFFLTRFTVTLAVTDDPEQFYLAGVVPLVLGLGLSAFGVALAVGDVDRTFVRTTAAWCVVGTATMLVLAVLTILGTTAGGLPTVETIRSQSSLATFLIGGSVGGTLTGLYAVRNRRQQRALRQHTNRLAVLNRLLRHEVLNSLTAIQGYAALDDDADGRAQAIIERRVTAIEETIEEVKYLTGRGADDAGAMVPIELGPSLAASVETIRERYPDAELTVDSGQEGVAVLANRRVEQVFTHLLENAVVHGDPETQAVDVSVATTPNSVRVSVADQGPGLPAEQRRLLEDGDIGEFDDPRAGFGLNVVRLLVESYRGSVETTVTDDGSTVLVVLPRPVTGGTGLQPDPHDISMVRVSPPRLLVTVGAALLAGAIMGVATELLGGAVPVIGTLYGVESAVVGWITHEFHSVVFGFVFAGIATAVPGRVRTSLVAIVGLALAWSLVLWAVAAGVVMPVWLNLVGVPADVPTLSGDVLVTHAIWGLSLGTLIWVGYGRVAPRLTDSWQHVRHRFDLA